MSAWVISGHTDKPAPCPLYPNNGRWAALQVSIWLSVYGTRPSRGRCLYLFPHQRALKSTRPPPNFFLSNF